MHAGKWHQGIDIIHLDKVYNINVIVYVDLDANQDVAVVSSHVYTLVEGLGTRPYPILQYFTTAAQLGRVPSCAPAHARMLIKCLIVEFAHAHV